MLLVAKKSRESVSGKNQVEQSRGHFVGVQKFAHDQIFPFHRRLLSKCSSPGAAAEKPGGDESLVGYERAWRGREFAWERDRHCGWGRDSGAIEPQRDDRPGG